MSDLLEYNPAMTRDLMRCIVNENDTALQTLRAFVRENGGNIGNAEFSDIEIRDGKRVLIQRQHLRVNDEHWNATAHQLNSKHAWDADGIWLPAKEV